MPTAFETYAEARSMSDQELIEWASKHNHTKVRELANRYDVVVEKLQKANAGEPETPS